MFTLNGWVSATIFSRCLSFSFIFRSPIITLSLPLLNVSNSGLPPSTSSTLSHFIFDLFYICDIDQPSTRTFVNWTFSSCNRAISSQPQAFGISKTGWFLCPRNKKKTNNYWDLIFFMSMSLCFYVLTTSSRKGWKIDLAACDWHLCPWDTSHLHLCPSVLGLGLTFLHLKLNLKLPEFL